MARADRVAALGALLFAAGEPVARERLAALLACTAEELEAALRELAERAAALGLMLLAHGEAVQLATAPEHGTLIAQLFGGETGRLSPGSAGDPGDHRLPATGHASGNRDRAGRRLERGAPDVARLRVGRAARSTADAWATGRIRNHPALPGAIRAPEPGGASTVAGRVGDPPGRAAAFGSARAIKIGPLSDRRRSRDRGGHPSTVTVPSATRRAAGSPHQHRRNDGRCRWPQPRRTEYRRRCPAVTATAHRRSAMVSFAGPAGPDGSGTA
jgi:hypothetical protein